MPCPRSWVPPGITWYRAGCNAVLPCCTSAGAVCGAHQRTEVGGRELAGAFAGRGASSCSPTRWLLCTSSNPVALVAAVTALLLVPPACLPAWPPNREDELKQIRKAALLGSVNDLVFSGGSMVIAMAGERSLCWMMDGRKHDSSNRPALPTDHSCRATPSLRPPRHSSIRSPLPAALLTYAGMGYSLTASVAFPALSLFNLLRFPGAAGVGLLWREACAHLYVPVCERARLPA